jgi:sulfur-carrier protein
MIRVVLPAHLRTLAHVDGEVKLQIGGPATLGSVLDALEACYPMLRGTMRDHVTHERRAFLRFFACGQDLSHEPPDTLLPEAVAMGAEPFLIVGAMAGGSEAFVEEGRQGQQGWTGTLDQFAEYLAKAI